MKPVSEGIYGLLMRQGLRAGSLAGDDAHGIGDGANAGKSAQHHQPAREEGATRPMGMRKSPGNAGAGSVYNGLGEKPREPTPANRRVLKLVVDNSRCMPLRDPTRSAQRGSGIHLVFSN